MKLVTFKFAGKRETRKVEDSIATQIQAAMDAGTPAVTFAGITIKTKDVQSIQPAGEGPVGGAFTVEKCKALRFELIQAAAMCRICPRDLVNGKVMGRGFVQVGDAMVSCECQQKTKVRFGLDPFDVEWYHKDEHERTYERQK